jgi:PAS domain S-box-containing protein
VFRRFIGVFARAAHPLALFLDDLQWLDAATLDLLEDLLTRSDLQHLMLIGAYRDNEVDAAHPLMRKLDEIRQAAAQVQEIRLAPLARDQLGQLIADALRCKPSSAAPLAQLVHEKTVGNPFFVMQFLHALAEEDLLTFDHDSACWRWDLDRIHAKRYTENVVDLMVRKLTRLPAETRQALQLLACLGNVAPIAILSIVLGTSEEQVHAALWEALRQELVERLDGSYKFTHDRVQEAAYSLIPEALRAETHLRIGRFLLSDAPPGKREEFIFEIVSQLNRSLALVISPDEREELAQLNLIAGKRAKNAAAYASALTHFARGRALLAEDCWTLQYPLTFELELHRAESELLTGELASAEERLSMLATRAANLVDQAATTCLRADLYAVRNRSDRTVALCLEYLRQVGFEWSPHPTDEDVRQAYERIWQKLGSRPIEDLIHLPLMTDVGMRATMNVLTKLVRSASVPGHKLHRLLIAHMAKLSLEYGNCNASCCGYVYLGRVLATDFGDHQAALRFGQLSLDLVDKRGLDTFKALVYMTFGTAISPRVQHVRLARAFLQRAFDEAIKVGDLYSVLRCRINISSNSLASGTSLDEVEREAWDGLGFSWKSGFGTFSLILTQLYLIRTLRGLPIDFKYFDGRVFSEEDLTQHLKANSHLAKAAQGYWFRRLQVCVFLADYVSAVEAAVEEQALSWTTPSSFSQAECQFYAALARAGSIDAVDVRPDQKIAHLEALTAHYRQLQIWAERCPENFENRGALVGAELARLEGRDLDAGRLYEQAIRSARANGFVHIDALACETAARFYAVRGFEDIAEMYLLRARDGYLRWGADGKVRQLEEIYPQLRTEEPASGPSSTIGASVEHLDLATVIKVSQAVSGEIVLEKLLDTLMRTAIAQVGAERGLLILARGAEPRIEAEATTGGETIVVRLCDDPIAAATLPETVLHYVLRVRESVILDDAAAEPSFAADPYIRQRKARSILCLPLINRGKLVGVLYLENNLTPRAFAPARIAVLKLLASQAAISLENTRLYRDLAEREAKIRRLVDANIIGILIWEIEGRIVEANDAFLRMVGYDRGDLAAGRLRWTDLTPPEWRDGQERHVSEAGTSGNVQPFEKEYFRKDGSRVPVLIGLAAFEQGGSQGVAFVLDLTERKRAEAAAREMQMELAHANRIATMGQLTASIAHEVNQPIAAARNNAAAALRFLSGNPPDMEEVREALGCIVKSTDRAGDIVDRIRAHVRKAPPQNVRFKINDVISELITLARSELVEKGVTIQLGLWEGLSPVQGDRVQLQQVVSNLILNAVEAMSLVDDAPRELSISTEPRGLDKVLVAVRDTGPGIDPDRLERVFDSFYTTKSRGMGLGLSICRSIVDAHGGRLWAGANEPGGAVFQFTLPAANNDS